MKILLAGEGGQGVQTVAKIISLAAQQSNRKSSYIPSFGVEQRGGVSLAYIQIDDNPIPYPRFEKADIIVAFCNRAIEPIKKYVTNETLFIYDNIAILDTSLESIKNKVKNYVAIPAQKIAQEKYSTKTLNMILLGALANQLKDINFAKIEEEMLKTLADKIAKNPEIKEMNLNALHEGAQLAEGFNPENSPLQGAKSKDLVNSYSDDSKTWTRFPEYCKGCGLCIVRCPVKALQFGKEVGFLGNPLPEVDINKCIACELCAKTCPDGAIKVDQIVKL